MTNTRTFKKEIALVRKLWSDSQYAEAIEKVEELRAEYPGNPQLLIAWASLLQLLDDTDHSLEEARDALQKAIHLDDASPAASIELGRYLDSVEDDPTAASKAFSQAASTAKKLLIDALVGQAKAFLQLDRKTDGIRCLLEALQVTNLDYPGMNGKLSRPAHLVPIPGAIEEMLNEALGEASIKSV